MTAKAPLEGAVEAWGEAEDREWDLEEVGWGAQDRALVRQGRVFAPNAAPQPPIKLEYPVTRYSALSVAHPWLENKLLSNEHTT